MKNSILVLLVLFLVGCSSSKQELEFEKPEIQIPKKSSEPRKNKVLYILYKEHLYLLIKKIYKLVI